MNISVYIMTHRKCPLPSDPIYKPMHVGHAISGDLGYPGDDTGDSISEYNPLFGELTGIYWIWRNDSSSEIIGICHYRRYFMNDDHKILNANEITSLLNNHDIITSTRPEGTDTSYNTYAASHNAADYDILGKCIHSLCPEYDPSFEWFKNQRSGCFGNLTIMPKDLYDSYCEWMFGILFEASDHIDVSGYDLYHRRVYGFLSEILMNIWIHHNDIHAYECPVMFTAEKAETTELKRVIASLVKEHRITEARNTYYDITKIRPDVLLPESDISGELLLIEQILYIMDKENEAGITGLSRVSDDLFEILKFYKDCKNNISGLSEDDRLSDIAKDVILRFS